VKTQLEIVTRLSKIKSRAKRAYILDNLEKLPGNCKYNHIHNPNPLNYYKEKEFEVAPRKTNSLVVIQEDRPIRICTYGSDHPSKWNGDVCDDASVSAPCKYFESVRSKSDLEAEFDLFIQDDEEVYSKYPEIAALQWVTGVRDSRPYNLKLHFISLFVFVINWFKYLIRRHDVDNS
jgi:hypothetical protein